MRRLVGAAIVVIVGSAMSGGIASAKTSLLVNGSFEHPRLNGASARAFAAGQHVGAWSVTDGTVFVTSEMPPVEYPPVGDQVIGLRAPQVPGHRDFDGEICQTVKGMNPSTTYRIRFLATSVFDASTIDVTLGRTEVALVVLPGSQPAVYVEYAWTVTPVAGSESLCLHGHPLGDGSEPLVDAVRIKPVADE